MEQAQGVAQRVDSIIKLRSASVATAVRTLDLENLASEHGGNQVISTLRDQFPDFVSLEVLDEGGELLAMFGDLSLAEAGRKSRAEDVAIPASGQGSSKGLFHDYPQRDCFFITTSQTSTHGTTWFTRTRFARQTIEAALAAFNKYGTAELQPVSTGALQGARSAHSPEAPSVKVPTTGWSHEAGTEAQLLTPGWTIIVKGKSSGTFLSRYSVVVLGTLVLLLALTWTLARRGSATAKASAQRAPAKETSATQRPWIQPSEGAPQSALVRDKWLPGGEQTPIEHESEVNDGGQATILGAEAIRVETHSEPPSSPEIQTDVDTLEIEFSVLEEASDTIPEVFEVTWMEPDTNGDMPQKRQDVIVQQGLKRLCAQLTTEEETVFPSTPPPS